MEFVSFICWINSIWSMINVFCTTLRTKNNTFMLPLPGITLRESVALFLIVFFLTTCDIHEWLNLWDREEYETLPCDSNNSSLNPNRSRNKKVRNHVTWLMDWHALVKQFWWWPCIHMPFKSQVYHHKHNLYEDVWHSWECFYCTNNTIINHWPEIRNCLMNK